MRYGLTFRGGLNRCFRDMSAEEFEQVKTVKQNLVIFMGIEEKLNILLENYVEYERELLELSLGGMVFHGGGWSKLTRDIFTVNRRLANVLAAGRLYIDQVRHDISTIHGRDSTTFKRLEDLISEAYRSSLGYRSLEAIRNYMQHRSLPVHSLRYTATREPWPNDIRFRYGVIATMEIERLREDPKLKEAVLADLESKGSSIDITPLVRQYVESIGGVHEGLRFVTADDIRRWDRVLYDILGKARDAFGDQPLDLAVTACTESDNVVEWVSVFPELVERRKLLEGKHLAFGGLSSRYASGAAGDA